MTTYPIDRHPADPPTLRLSVVLGALVAGLALLLALSVAHNAISTIGDGLELSHRTADRISELDAMHEDAEAGQ